MSTGTRAAALAGEDAKAALVLNWRFDVLSRAGYAEEAAVALAQAQVDLHDAVALVERGCPPDTAFRILV